MQLTARHIRAVRRPGAIALGAALLALPLALPMSTALAADALPFTVGAGVRTSFTNTDVDGASEDINDFELTNARIYIGGQVNDDISLMFNTEYSTFDEKIQVIDAVAKFEYGKMFNVWAGRFLPPSDRANMYGPFYASHFGSFIDGVQDGYPSETTGRDDGVMYWGQFGGAKISAGVFDVPASKGDSDVLYAVRAQFDFWDAEDGYYLNGTYYGEKDLLAVGVASQKLQGNDASTVDFLLEKKLGNGGVFTLEAEYANYDGLGGYPTPLAVEITPGPLVTLVPLPSNKSDGFYVLGAYLFPQVIGVGRFQVLLKGGEATFEFPTAADVDQTTTEFNLNYIIKDFKARISLFYIDVDFKPTALFVAPDFTRIGLGLQVQI
jgi:hypothetical protein